MKIAETGVVITRAASGIGRAVAQAMTLPMARDLSSIGIRVNTIAPGLIATPLLAARGGHRRERLHQRRVYPGGRRYPHATALGEDPGIDQAPPGQWTSSQFMDRSAAVLVVISALVPRVLMVVAVMIAIVVTLMVTRARDDTGGGERNQAQ
jgi:NAD(P)-dependent dehydrogenase (short-subunit alcohol dehydrogenase family)